MSYRAPGESRILESDMTTNSNAMSRHSIRAILLGGLIAGFCDLTYAMTYYAMHGVAAIRIPQSIASGVLGSASFKGGWKTAVFGVLLHFFTAFCAAGFYYAASRKLRLLLRWAPIARNAIWRGHFLLHAARRDSVVRRASSQVAAVTSFGPISWSTCS